MVEDERPIALDFISIPKMKLHPIVSFLVGVILDLLQLKLNGNGNGNGNGDQGGVSSDDGSTSPFNTHPVMIFLGLLWLLLYSWVALASSTTATATSSASPSNSAVAPATSSAKMAVAETPLSSASTAASCSSSLAQATSSNSLPSAVAETVLSAASEAASCSSPAATSNPSLLSQTDAEVAIRIDTSSPTVAVSATGSWWISMILGKISYPASKLIAKIKCHRQQLMLMFALMAISTFGCLLFPTSAQYRVLYTSYALIIGFNVIFLCLFAR